MAEINVVPYIDVMLVLLVIFMVTAPLYNLGVQVDLPKLSERREDIPHLVRFFLERFCAREDIPIPASRISMGIAGRVLRTGQGLLSVDIPEQYGGLGLD